MEYKLTSIADDLDVLDGQYRQMVLEGLEALAEKITAGELRTTAGELAKLIEIEKELRTSAARKIQVEWIEPTEETEYADEE